MDKSAVYHYQKNDIIATEGEYDDGWFILLSGTVGVLKKGVLIAEFSKAGTVLGELSGILHRPRTATLKALEPTDVVYIKKSLEEIIAQHPDIAKKIIINLAERLAQTTEELWTAIVQKEAGEHLNLK